MSEPTIESRLDAIEQRLNEPISDKMRSFRHTMPNEYTWSVAVSTQPQKTWLDDCAFQAMGGMLAKGQTNDRDPSYISKKSYQIAQSMLAEKQRIEKE